MNPAAAIAYLCHVISKNSFLENNNIWGNMPVISCYMHKPNSEEKYYIKEIKLFIQYSVQRGTKVT